MACMASNKVQINAGDAITRKGNKQTHTKVPVTAPVDSAVTVSSESNKVSHFLYKATDGNVYRANHATKP